MDAAIEKGQRRKHPTEGEFTIESDVILGMMSATIRWQTRKRAGQGGVMSLEFIRDNCPMVGAAAKKSTLTDYYNAAYAPFMSAPAQLRDAFQRAIDAQSQRTLQERAQYDAIQAYQAGLISKAQAGAVFWAGVSAPPVPPVRITSGATAASVAAAPPSKKYVSMTGKPGSWVEYDRLTDADPFELYPYRREGEGRSIERVDISNARNKRVCNLADDRRHRAAMDSRDMFNAPIVPPKPAPWRCSVDEYDLLPDA